MSALLKSASVGAITLFAEDLERSKLFYQEVFGLPVAFEDENSAVFRFENTIINLLAIPAARREPDLGITQDSGQLSHPFLAAVWSDSARQSAAGLVHQELADPQQRAPPSSWARQRQARSSQTSRC